MSDALAVVIFGVAGAVAGGAGAVLVDRVPRGVRVPVPVCVILVAALWGAVGGRTGELPVWWWPIPLLLGWAGVLLGAADLVARRLPDALTLPAYPLVAVLIGIVTAGSGDTAPLLRAVAGGLLWAGGYATVRLIAPDALGGGDVKLAGSLGALSAAASWPDLFVAMLVAATLTAAVAGPARIFGHREVPHAPAMLAAALLVVLGAPA